MSDLISRGALAKAMGVENAVKYGNETADQQHNSYDTLMKYEIADYIEDAPDVDAAPVVHARLKETGWDEAWCQWGDCTKCGHSNIIGSKYCNQCGAKLDGGAEG